MKRRSEQHLAPATSFISMARGGLPLRRSGRLAGAALAAGVVLCCGCGMSQGQLLWAMGFGRGQKVAAEFELTRKGPVLILVDDHEERLDSPATRTTLAKMLGKELVTRKSIKQLVPQQALARLRREHLDFEERGCREVGRMAKADQVLWVQVRDFLASSQVEETIAAARMSVTVKVIDALADEAGEERLWPVDRNGQIVSTELHANEVLRAKNARVISIMLTDKMAEEVAKLFYDHRLEEE